MLSLLHPQVAQLHEREHQEVLPRLQSLLEEVQTARVFAREQLVTDLKQSWQMPAMHLVPHHTCKCAACGRDEREPSHTVAVVCESA
jgi:ribosomal protein L7/L12